MTWEQKSGMHSCSSKKQNEQTNKTPSFLKEQPKIYPINFRGNGFPRKLLTKYSITPESHIYLRIIQNKEREIGSAINYVRIESL